MKPAHVAALVEYWQTFDRNSLAHIGERYAEDSRFRDPFNDVRGHAELHRIFSHMFEALDEPRFRIVETIYDADSNRATLIWDFDFRIRKLIPDKPRRIHGNSVIRFGHDGRVTEHIDYWDAAGELYEHLPLVGSLMRWLRRRMT